MKVVIQRVESSSVKVSEKEISSINNGLLLLWGVEKEDTIEDVDVLTEKILNLRIFSDEEGKMNKSIVDVDYALLLAWIFKDDIMKKESNFIQNGGKFIIPMPQPHFEP